MKCLGCQRDYREYGDYCSEECWRNSGCPQMDSTAPTPPEAQGKPFPPSAEKNSGEAAPVGDDLKAAQEYARNRHGPGWRGNATDGFMAGIAHERAKVDEENETAYRELQDKWARTLREIAARDSRIAELEEALGIVRRYFAAQDLPSHCVTLKETMDLRYVAKRAIEELSTPE